MTVAAAVSALPDRLRVREDGSPVLLGVRCAECGTSFFGTVDHCRRCTSERLEPVELGARGTVHSYTVVYRAAADWGGPLPYALAEVALPSGAGVLSRVVDWQEGDVLAIGSELELATESIGADDDGNDRVVYVWRRAT